MFMGSATASHTYNLGGYKVKVNDNEYKKLKNAKKTGESYTVFKKSGHYKTHKVAKYKSVKKKVWVHKKVLQSKDVWSSDWSDYTYYNYNIDKYWKNGWTWYGSTTTKENGGHVYKNYAKFKKQVTKKVNVKDGYKKIKAPVYFTLYSSGYYSLFDDYNDDIKHGKINI